MSIPENHVTAEGRTLRAAIEAAAAELGVAPALVEHKLDLAHFRSAAGTGVGVDTVKIKAWAKDPGEVAPALDAEEWMKGLLAAMDRTGTVRAEARAGSVMVRVDVGEAGRHLVGRGGTTLRAVQYLMEQSVGAKYPGASFKIDVARAEGEERRDDRGERRDDRGERRDDRGERRDDRGERRDFGARRDDRPPRRDDRRDDRPRGDRRDDRRGGDRRSEGDTEDLRRLARKIANIVLDRGEAEVIRRELNSYDRRIVHVEIAGIAGVGSRSVGEGHDRRIEIYPAPDNDGTGEAEQG